MYGRSRIWSVCYLRHARISKQYRSRFIYIRVFVKTKECLWYLLKLSSKKMETMKNLKQPLFTNLQDPFAISFLESFVLEYSPIQISSFKVNVHSCIFRSPVIGFHGREAKSSSESQWRSGVWTFRPQSNFVG